MNLGEFPEEQTLNYKIGHTHDLYAEIDATCPPDMPFASATDMDPEAVRETYDYANNFYTTHVDRFTIPDTRHVAEPLYFAIHTARLLQNDRVKIPLPTNAEWGIRLQEDGEPIDGWIMFEAYLQQNAHVNALIQVYMDRLSGVDAMHDHVIEPPEVRHARLLAGATFLMVDLVNASAFHEEQQRLFAAFEAQFSSEF